MKPILFNTEMVQAIMDGRKTVTRRAVKSNKFDLNNCCAVEINKNPCEMRIDKHGYEYPFQLNGLYATFDDGRCFPLVKSAYQPNDVLYVRETWQKNPYGSGWPYFYKAYPEQFDPVPEKWRPSIHMPREAARIFLRVKSVRVERLQNIDDDGVAAEGFEIGAPFDDLWDGTIKKSDIPIYGWNANPWVWVTEFERISREEAVE